jgi:hypothetical protein
MSWIPLRRTTRKLSNSIPTPGRSSTNCALPSPTLSVLPVPLHGTIGKSEASVRVISQAADGRVSLRRVLKGKSPFSAFTQWHWLNCPYHSRVLGGGGGFICGARRVQRTAGDRAISALLPEAVRPLSGALLHWEQRRPTLQQGRGEGERSKPSLNERQLQRGQVGRLPSLLRSTL